MGKLYKVLIAGKKCVGKTLFLEQLIYNRQCEKYFPTIEDIYVAYWEKEKNIKEKFRLYDTKGMDSLIDIDTIDSYRYLFTMIDACILIYSSSDVESYMCIEKIKSEIEKEKIKEKSRDIIHFIAIDYDLTSFSNNNKSQQTSEGTIASSTSSSQLRSQIQAPLKGVNYYEVTYDKREQLLRAFNDLALNMTQINTKNIVKPKIPKVFQSSK